MKASMWQLLRACTLSSLTLASEYALIMKAGAQCYQSVISITNYFEIEVDIFSPIGNDNTTICLISIDVVILTMNTRSCFPMSMTRNWINVLQKSLILYTELPAESMIGCRT